MANVLIVSQYFFPENFVINHIARALSANNHNITVLTGFPNYPSGDYYEGYRWPWPRRETADGINILRVPLIPRRRGRAIELALNYLSFAATASLAALFLRGKADVILVYQPSPVTVGLPALVAKWITRAPLLLWVQDLWPDSLTATGAIKSRTLLDLVRRLVRFIYRRSEIIAVPSRAFCTPVALIAPGSDIRYLPNPADATQRECTADRSENHRLKPGFRLVFAGNLGVAQGLETVLDAAEATRHVPEIKWIMIGEGRMRAELEAHAAARGLSETVEITGPFPSDRMPGLFAQADVLLMTLRRDPLFELTVPSKLQTYLAAGRPILAALDGEAARIVLEANAGICCPAGDAAALAAAAIRLHGMTASERDAMGGAARTYHAREFSLRLIVDRLEGWLTEMRGARACVS